MKRVALMCLGLLMLWAAAFCNMRPVEAAQGPSWGEMPPSAPYITIDGPPIFVDKVGTALLLLDDTYPTNYYFWWASVHGVVVRYQTEGDGIGMGWDMVTKEMSVGPSLPAEDAVLADMLIWPIQTMRDYAIMGPCLDEFVRFRGLSSAMAYSGGLHIQSGWYLEWLEGEWWKVYNIMRGYGEPRVGEYIDSDGVTHTICVGWQNGGF